MGGPRLLEYVAYIVARLRTLWASVACFCMLRAFALSYTILMASIHQAVVIYDWILSVDREVAYIWNSGPSSASIIYLTLRYVSSASFIVTMMNLFPYVGKSSAVSKTVP